MNVDGASKSSWKPRENVLVASLLEHTHAVNHVAVAADQSFFATASSDKTVKIWKVRGLDSAAFPRSAYTYLGHRGSVLGVCCLENSHSVATCADDGSLHVWRVDMSNPHRASTIDPNGSGGVSDGTGMGSANATGNPRLQGKISASELKIVKSDEGPVMAVNHFNGDITSVLTYITQQGGIYGHDLRCCGDAFKFSMRPELGHLSSMTIAPDRNWVCVGTSRGYIGLWDIRYGMMAKLWRHSARSTVHRIACCKALPRGLLGHNAMSSVSPAGGPGGVKDFVMQSTEGAYLFVAAGINEAAVWGIPEGGECYKCFRSIPISAANEPIRPLPYLEDIDIPRHPLAPVHSAYLSAGSEFGTVPTSATDPSFRAIMGRISHTGTSYLVTAGSDAMIRYWDFSTPAKCFTVSGLLPAQPRPILSAPTHVNDGVYGKLFVSHDSALPSADAILQAQLPQREGRGAQLPSQGFKVARFEHLHCLSLT
jgi:phosphoinositide-3-kinase regulatory subunit 4